MEKFIIVKDIVKHVKRFRLTGRTIDFKIKDIPKNEEPVSWIKSALSDIVYLSTSNLAPRDKIGFSFCSKNFSRGEGWLPFKEVNKVVFEDIWSIIQGVYQSNSSGFDTDTFCLGVTTVRMPLGKGRRSGDKTFEEESARRRGIVQIKNIDNLCLPRALVVAIAHVKKQEPEYVKVRRDIGKIQKERAMKLMEEANVVIPEEGAGILEIRKFQEHFGEEYKIVTFQHGSKGRDVIFEGHSGGKHLNLLYHAGHYNVIVSLTAAFCCGYYCVSCHAPYNDKNRHRCGGICSGCQQSPVCLQEARIKCNNCLRFFKSIQCFENHKKTRSNEKNESICEQIRHCPLCLRTIKTNREHTCGEIFCKICSKHQPQGHLCFIQPDTRRPQSENILFVFFDLETRQEQVLEDGSLLHEVNLCVFKQFCDSCIDSQPWFCEKCGVTKQILKVNPLDRFVEYVLNQRTLFKKVIVISHNGGGFDNQFILNKLITETEITPEVIMRGTKIILMQILNVNFLDSLNYFPMALSKLPKAFGLEDKFKKGYFPHFFNKTENESYVGPLPAVEYYAPDNMKVEDRKIFLEWYEHHRNELFDFQKEIVEYCVSDVDILYETCKKFREQMISSTNVCPFTEATTIASTCNKVFRRNFIKPDTIGIIPKNGYRFQDNQSIIASKWLIWEEHQRKIEIQHSAKEKEAIIGGVKVDGFSTHTSQIFEFHGCYFHGHPECLKHHRDSPLPDNPTETLNVRYENTEAKTERLRILGYEVIEMWECHFRRQMEENPVIKEFTESHSLLFNVPLNPREAFYGGRTGNCKTYFKVGKNEKIKYLDVCSLYPWICKTAKFPIGHPKVFIGDECKQLNLQHTEGIIKCKILPPQSLYHPVLPLKMKGKLMFVLCKTCGETMNYNQCTHDNDSRALEGTWVIDEVKKAIEMGYKILNIMEIWQYKTEIYNPQEKTGGLFVEMMNKFIKIKQEASGWPSECITLQQKTKYIQDFYNREGIKLETNNISKNPGLRAQAKLMLNSFWGKFGQSECQAKCKIIKSPEEFYSIMTNPCLEVNSALPINEDTILVNYQFTEESYNPLSTVSVAIAAYVTAQARLKLYSYLDQLGQRVLYYDTDSVIFTHKEGETEPATGEFIGDLTDELESFGVGSYITEFVCGGPKNYAYKVFSTLSNDVRIICKVKGICLDYQASQLVNFNSIKEMILNCDKDPITITSRNIRRTKKHEIITKKESKIYRPNSTKRLFLENHDSVPFGFKKPRLELANIIDHNLLN